MTASLDRAGPAPATLLVTSGPQQGSRIEVPAGGLVFGRAAGSASRLGDDQALSRWHARFDVADEAMLVFPPSLGVLCDGLRASGLAVGEITPSTIVRERLSQRYGLPARALDLSIVRAFIPAVEGPKELEIFALKVPAGSRLEEVAVRERAERRESHLAFEIVTPDAVTLPGLRAMLIERGGMRVDGGGYSPYENTSVFYFRSPHHVRVAATSGYCRLELRVRGHHPQALALHLPSTTSEAAKRLLSLMTGAWATQAIAVAAELKLADHMHRSGVSAAGEAGPGTVSVTELADLVGAAPNSLGRLLRYLAALDLAVPVGDSYALTEIGELLRGDTDHSMGPLALLYGGPFYESFGNLVHSVRTGEDAFERHFSKPHFPYFAEYPEWAGVFEQAMAASAPMFGPVAAAIDRPGVQVVVDVAGGNGELLTQVLGGAPHLQGVLLEQAHVIEAAKSHLQRAGCADRCTFVAGDFNQLIPGGGDIYLLSRVLHDWDDAQCLAILRRCARAMPHHAELLVVERLLPTDATPSLAVAWDVHMLCNVGGRERSAEHYRRLLTKAGFELTDVTELPLEGFLLRARRILAAGPQGSTNRQATD